MADLPKPDLPEPDLPEPWLRGTLTEVPPVQRAVLHALELAEEDLKRWCGGLTDEEINARPSGLPPVAFQLRHIARSLDRLLTYAEGGSLGGEQLAKLKSESAQGARRVDLFCEFEAAIRDSVARIRAYGSDSLELVRRCWPATIANDCWRFTGSCRRPYPTSRGSSHYHGEDRAGPPH